MIHVPYWWHASLFEILWLAGGIAAGALTVLNLHDAWKDNAVLDTIRFDPDISEQHYEMISLSAQGRLSSQAFRLVVSCLITFAGGVGCLTVNPLRGATTITGLVVTVALLGISLLTATIAFLDMIRRNRMYELATGRTEVIEARARAENHTDDLPERNLTP